MKKSSDLKLISILKKSIYTKKTVKILCIFTAAFFLGSFAGFLAERFSSAPGKGTGAEAVPASAEGNWGLSFQEEGQTPAGNATFEELARYDAYYAEDTEERSIYLTFDAGYENGNTGPILDALKKHNVPATFFVVGTYIESEPELIKRMAEEGHTVGNHTWHHPDMSAISTMDAFKKELVDVEDIYRDVTGQEMTKFYRPPQGKYNEENLKMAQQLGYKTFFWSLAYVDWYEDDQPTQEEAFEKLLGRIHPVYSLFISS